MNICGPYSSVYFVSIYALIGPDGRCRYIGRTGLPLPQRFQVHASSRTRAGEWIRSCGGRVRIARIRYVCSRKGIGRAERAWIAAAARAGRDLLNIQSVPRP